MKKAIILAAGIGKRLGDLTKRTPKCLLPTDDENTLLDLSVKSLIENSISEIIIVTGFGAEILKNHIETKWKNKITFKFVFNEKFNEYNNIYSAYLAKDFLDDETILLNSDIIYDPAILKKLVGTYHGKSLLVIDDTKRLTDESMKVKVNSNGEIKEINKALEIKTSFGEYIGITYLKGLERLKFLDSLERNVKNKNLDLYYEDALGSILDKISVYPFSTQGKLWTEIDDVKDYEIAKTIAKKIKQRVSAL